MYQYINFIKNQNMGASIRLPRRRVVVDESQLSSVNLDKFAKYLLGLYRHGIETKPCLFRLKTVTQTVTYEQGGEDTYDERVPDYYTLVPPEPDRTYFDKVHESASIAVLHQSEFQRHIKKGKKYHWLLIDGELFAIPQHSFLDIGTDPVTNIARLAEMRGPDAKLQGFGTFVRFGNVVEFDALDTTTDDDVTLQFLERSGIERKLNAALMLLLEYANNLVHRLGFEPQLVDKITGVDDDPTASTYTFAEYLGFRQPATSYPSHEECAEAYTHNTAMRMTAAESGLGGRHGKVTYKSPAKRRRSKRRRMSKSPGRRTTRRRSRSSRRSRSRK